MGKDVIAPQSKLFVSLEQWLSIQVMLNGSRVTSLPVGQLSK